MQTAIRGGQDERIFYSATTFRLLLDALARPGKIVQLVAPAFLGDTPGNAYAFGALLTLIDGEVGFAVGDAGRWLDVGESAAQWLTLRSGSRVVAPDAAAFALLSGGKVANLLPTLNQGTLAVPEASATAIICVDALVGQPFTAGYTALELRGPGVPDVRVIGVAGLDAADTAALQQTRLQYPLGIDVYLVNGLGQCVGLPRTTKIVV